MNRKLIIVEDAPFCSILVKKMVTGQPFDIKTVDHVDKIAEIDLNNEDVVLLDLIGTGSEKMNLSQDVRIISMSSNPELKPELIKPFNQESLFKVLFPDNEGKVA